MNRYTIIFSFVLGLFLATTELVLAATTLEGLIINTSFFIRNIILPLLISVAFLFFLINMMRYFLVQSGSEEGRTKARRSATYGVIAFVFLFTIWAIVGLILGGLNIEERTSLCPDYLADFCGDANRGNGPSGATFPTITPGTVNPPTVIGPPSVDPFTGDITPGGLCYNAFGDPYVCGEDPGDGTLVTDPDGPGDTGPIWTGGGGSPGYTPSVGPAEVGNKPATSGPNTGLAELVFGTGKDSAAFTTFAGEPRSAFNAPPILESATCETGLDTLLQASRVETAQAAYVMYKNNTGATRWRNLTDLNSTNHIGYDNDILESVVNSGAQDVHVVHVHPKDRVEQQSLVMHGHGPSAADMRAMCEVNNPNIKHLTVDWNGVWILSQRADTCPYNQQALTVLPLIETYNDIATLDSSRRAAELDKYTDSPLVATTFKNHFTDILISQFSSLSPEEVIGRSRNYQTFASTTVAYKQPVASFCNAYENR